MSYTADSKWQALRNFTTHVYGEVEHIVLSDTFQRDDSLDGLGTAVRGTWVEVGDPVGIDGHELYVPAKLGGTDMFALANLTVNSGHFVEAVVTVLPTADETLTLLVGATSVGATPATYVTIADDGSVTGDVLSAAAASVEAGDIVRLELYEDGTVKLLVNGVEVDTDSGVTSSHAYAGFEITNALDTDSVVHIDTVYVGTLVHTDVTEANGGALFRTAYLASFTSWDDYVAAVKLATGKTTLADAENAYWGSLA